jgi:hypothetical protein
MAAGNQGCKMNCADFPAAANIIPKMAIFSKNVFLLKKIISLSFQVLKKTRVIIMNKIIPLSPIRL